MEEIVKLRYGGDTMDAINFVETLAEVLEKFGINIEFLDGGDGYEEVKITKI